MEKLAKYWIQLSTIKKLLETMIVGEVSRILNTIIHYQKLLDTMIVGEWDWKNGFGLKYVINNQNENN